MTKAVDRFGELMTKKMRDRGINFYDKLADGQWKAPALQSLQKELAALPVDSRTTVRTCVVRTLDNAIHDFLFALQEAHDSGTGVAVMVDDANVAAESDGLQGEPYGSRGWIAKYSMYPEGKE